MSAEAAYVNKKQKNETTNLWHGRLDHLSYNKLKIVIKKIMLKELSQLVDITEDMIYVFTPIWEGVSITI